MNLSHRPQWLGLAWLCVLVWARGCREDCLWSGGSHTLELGLLGPVSASAVFAICLPSLPLSIGSESSVSSQKQHIRYCLQEALLDSDPLPETIPFFEFAC